MKKEYLTPEIEIIGCESEEKLCLDFTLSGKDDGGLDEDEYANIII